MTAPLYGILAEFPSDAGAAAAVRHLRFAGFRAIEAYSPLPVPGLELFEGGRPKAMPLAIFACTLLGGVGGFLMQYWGAAIAYPLNVGGRPLNSWPAFLPTSFEIAVLFAVAGGVIAWFVANRLPRLASPLAAVPGFERASSDRFFVCVAAEDPRFDAARIRNHLERCAALRIIEVPA